MQDAQAHPSYRTYWIAWLVLLGLTLFMIGVATPPVLLVGMAAKAGIILCWFMHLRYERLSFVLTTLCAIFATGLLLFLLIAPDGMAM